LIAIPNIILKVIGDLVKRNSINEMGENTKTIEIQYDIEETSINA